MSFFYLTPVKGDMPLHLLETVVNNRLDYLNTILKEGASVYNEYVVEGSIYDNVGHFMLCVLSILSENYGFIQFISKTELELFKKRIVSLSAYDMRLFAKKLLRGIRKLESAPSFVSPLQILCQYLVLKDLAHHICAPTHLVSCAKHNIGLHFKHCLPFVARRQLEMRNGQVLLPCGKWKQYLFYLFTTNLKYRLNTKLSPLRGDVRIMQILAKVKHNLPVIRNNNSIVLSRDVDTISELFPPCMMNLHQYLRRKHRLSHTQRFYYSLYLKDIGMPVEEAVEFWRAEYRQDPNSHKCLHSWEKDEKKYLYSIRHMYGLEGCRKNYTSVSCTRIQNSDTSCSEGGCPFKSFDSDRLSQILQKSGKFTENIMTQIYELKRRHQYTSACVLYLQKCLVTNCDSSFNFTPVKYYMHASKSKCVDL